MINKKRTKSKSKSKTKRTVWPVQSNNKSLAHSVSRSCTFRLAFSPVTIGFVVHASLSLLRPKSPNVLLAEKIWRRLSETLFLTALFRITSKLTLNKKDLINKKTKPERKTFLDMTPLIFSRELMVKKSPSRVKLSSIRHQEPEEADLQERLLIFRLPTTKIQEKSAGNVLMREAASSVHQPKSTHPVTHVAS